MRSAFLPCPRICPLILQSAPASDPAQHLEFLTDLLSRISQDKSPDAHVLVLSTLAHAKLLFGDLEGSKADIDAAWKILDDLDAVDNSVNGAYYRVAADYYKVRFVGVKTSTSPTQYVVIEQSGKGRICTVLQELAPLPCLRRPGKGHVTRRAFVTCT